MSDPGHAGAGKAAEEPGTGNSRLAILLSMAMFVLVVDTSIMNVSISAVVHDVGTTVSGVQSAIALEALVSAAFILIGSKVGDLIGRKRAYALGLIAYGIGALAMALAQSLTVIIVFWSVIGGLGASLLLPAMQSLIHGNFEGAAQRKAYALVGAAAAVAAAVGPLVGGFITTYLSWRIAFLLEDVVILVVLLGLGMIKDVPYTGPRHIDIVGAVLSVVGMGGIVLGILVWQEGGESVLALLIAGSLSMGALAYWLVHRHRQGRPALIDPTLFARKAFRFGISGQMFQQIVLGGLMISLPIYLQIVFEYSAIQAGLSLAPLSLSMFAVALVAGKKAGNIRPASIIQVGFALVTVGTAVLIPLVPRADSGWYLVVPLLIVGSGLGLLVSQLNNYTLSPIPEERVSEAAGVNSAGGSFRPLVRPRIRRSCAPRHSFGVLHQPLGAEHGAQCAPASACLECAGARCRVHDQHPTGHLAGPRTQGDAGRDHRHQHRGAAPRPAVRAARAPGRRRAGLGQLLPHAPPAGPAGLGCGGGACAGLMVLARQGVAVSPRSPSSRPSRSGAGRSWR
jgi:MFS family permease